MDYYEVQDIARNAAADACGDLRRELEREAEIDRQDWREMGRDIREGFSELNERVWHIEVKLGIRKPGGQWIGYGESAS
jgi:hypothetical protein